MKKEKKITFWSILIKAIKDAHKKYKAEMQLQVEKHRLLSSKSDWSMLESFVQQCNNDPNLKVEITLNDGTKILMRSYNEMPKRDYELLEVSE